MVEETATENIESTGNFEQDYLDECKKVGAKPMTILKFGHVLPPLPFKVADLTPSPTLSTKNSFASGPPSRVGSGRKSAATAIPEDIETTAALNPQILTEIARTASTTVRNAIPLRKVISDRRETSIQEFLKKGQIEFNSAVNILTGAPWNSNTAPYTSRYRFTPTIDVETAENEEGEEEVVYKIQMRGWKADLVTFEVLNSIIPNLPNLVNIKYLYLTSIWNCGLNDQHFQLLSQMVSVGNIRHLELDQNPLISESLYSQLLTDESFLHVLSLRGNNITDNGAKAIANALRTNRVLLSLNLFDNKIQKGAAEAFSEVNRFHIGFKTKLCIAITITWEKQYWR